MKYLELIIEFDRNLQEELLAELTSAGFSSLVINDPEDLKEIEEHPEWYKYDYIEESLADNAGKPTITVYFSDDEEGMTEAQRVETVLGEFEKRHSDAAKWTLAETTDDCEWLYKWQENFKPTKVGEHIVVKPSWEEYSAKEGELVIEMDPGMAFGSGLHETTTLCIKALERILSCNQEENIYAQEYKSYQSEEVKRPKNLRVLDVGTGTGILAIAAVMLGAERCLGIDIDADAVRIAKENVERNGLTDRIELCKGDLMEGVDFQADIIVANLMADLVVKLAPAAAEHIAPGGIFISSGILDIKEDIVAEAVRKAGFEILEVLHDGEWCAIVAEKEGEKYGKRS